MKLWWICRGAAPGVAPLDLDLRTGEVVGLAGLEGSGTSTVLEMLGGAIPAAGEIVVAGNLMRFRHPADAIRAGVVYSSSDTAVITVRGRGGHGAKPHLAVDPIVAASHVVIALQSIVSREVHPNEMAIVTVGAFHAGDAPNVIPASAELRLTIRARSEAVRAQLRDRITAVAQAQAVVHGATADVDYRLRYPVTVNDEAATAWLREVARETVGEAGLIPDWPPGTASDDLGLMLQRVPGCYFNVGNGTDERPGQGGCPVHNAGYDFNDRILPSTASLFVRVVQKYLVEA